MMQIIPTWGVRTFFPWDDDESEGHALRVPDDDLESFLRVLMFNGVRKFQVEREIEPHEKPSDQLGKGIAARAFSPGVGVEVAY